MNLWSETLAILEEFGKSWDDIIDICGSDFCISKDNYKKVAIATYYDNGYGAPEIATDLELSGVDFKIIRNEYDGSEWFEFITFKQRKDENLVYVDRLKITNEQVGWRSLASVNGIEEDKNETK